MGISTNINQPRPIFDNREYTDNPFQVHHYDSSSFFKQGSKVTGSDRDYEFALKFIYSYTGSSATFNAYRREIERLLQWCWYVEERSILELRREHISAFIDFAKQPPKNWIGTKNVARFKNKDGERIANPDWRPYVVSVPKAMSKFGQTASIDDYELSQSAVKATFAILSSFYTFLMQEGLSDSNPVNLIRQKSQFIQKEQTQAPVRRLSKMQWDYLHEQAVTLAEEDPEKYERSLFILNCLFAMYLRISEIVADERSTPRMSHFEKDVEGNWWFHVTGKGNKNRIVTVSDDMIAALKRYRQFLGLPPLPVQGESTALICKANSRQAITSTRQIRSLLQELFDFAYEKMIADGWQEEAQELHAATAHWLRHTGISEDVKFRPREHVRDDAGHASMATTDKYIDSDLRERHASGRKKKIKLD